MRLLRSRRSKFVVAVLILAMVPIVIIVASYLIIRANQIFVLQQISSQRERVGLVLGAGVSPDNVPYKSLQARLDAGAHALKRGQVDKLILSGDNRFESYNEPNAMMIYLVEQQGIARDKLQPDYAGRSTYESCERAAKVFGLSRVIIFSAPSHLPRAIYLCRSFGIESYDVSSGVDAQNSRMRELQANVKAVFNVHIYGEKTVLGPRIKL